MGLAFDRNELVREVLQRIERFEGLAPDRLDMVEFVMELTEEFGQGVVEQAIREFERKRPLKVRSTRPSPTGPHPLWDKDLDG